MVGVNRIDLLIRGDVTTLVLTKGPRYGYHAYVTKKAEGSVLESSSKFVLAATAKGGKAFIHGVSLAATPV